MNNRDRPVCRPYGLLANFVPAGVIAWAICGIVQSEHLGRNPFDHIIAAAIAFPMLKTFEFTDSNSSQGDMGRISFAMIANSAVSGESWADAGRYPPA